MENDHAEQSAPVDAAAAKLQLTNTFRGIVGMAKLATTSDEDLGLAFAFAQRQAAMQGGMGGMDPMQAAAAQMMGGAMGGMPGGMPGGGEGGEGQQQCQQQ
jgi:hypothetical protein